MSLRIVSFASGGQLVPGVLAADDSVVALVPTLARRGINVRSVLDILPIWSEVSAVVAEEIDAGRATVVPDGHVSLGPPIPDAGQVVAVGLNYAAHAVGLGQLTDRTTSKPSDVPVFSKAVTSISGPYDPVVAPSASDQLDYEVEVALVIGAPGYRIPRDRAMSHVFGYMLANDVTARDVLLPNGVKTSGLEIQILRGKGFPTFCPLGPWLVPADEAGADDVFDFELSVNGELRQSGSTKDMTFGFDEIVESVSRSVALRAGDVILTGTPAGCGFQLDPPRFLSPGDVIEARSSRLGVMRLPVSADNLSSADGPVGAYGA